MNKKELLAKIEKEINALENYLNLIPVNQYLERGITLGKINGLLTAKLYAIDLEENK